MKELEIILACQDLGVHVDGAKEGAKKLGEEINYKNTKTVMSLDIQKEHERDNLKKNLYGVNEFNERLYNFVKNSIKNNNKVLTIGGDHSIAIASALASISEYESLGIIWIDAHGDYNTFDTTITGNLHGLPLAVISGYENRLLSSFHESNKYSPKNTVIVGGRDLDPLEKENIKNAGVTLFTSDDIKTMGVNKVIDEAIKIASDGTNGIHISYDIDVIDPKVAPGVSIPAKDGIDEKTSYEIMSRVLEYKDKIKSFDLVEYNPSKDIDDKTLNIALNLSKKIIDEIL